MEYNLALYDDTEGFVDDDTFLMTSSNSFITPTNPFPLVVLVTSLVSDLRKRGLR